jgi:hypothetical protein
VYLEQKIDKILEIVSTDQKPANWEELLKEGPGLPPKVKLALIKAMGFTRHRAAHQMSCASLQGSGYICTCVWPATTWSAPDDVLAHLGQTFAERKAATEERNKRDYE